MISVCVNIRTGGVIYVSIYGIRCYNANDSDGTVEVLKEHYNEELR